jgi:hypothetical protein
VVAGEDDRLRARPHPELVEDIRRVIPDGLLPDVQAYSPATMAPGCRNASRFTFAVVQQHEQTPDQKKQMNALLKIGREAAERFRDVSVAERGATRCSSAA